MVDKNAVPEAEELDAEECWRLLREPERAGWESLPMAGRMSSR